VELVRLAARDRTDAAIAKPETPFVRVDELGGQFLGIPGAPSLARLRRDQGQQAEARDLLASVCDRFTEGFGTPICEKQSSLSTPCRKSSDLCSMVVDLS